MVADRRFGMLNAAAATLLAAVFGMSGSVAVVAQEQSTSTDTVTFGMETYESSEAAVRALFARQARLEDALRALQQQLAEVTAITNATSARLARGDDPLVSLEIEQLWAMVRSLEQENARLRDGYEELISAPGE